MRRIRRNWRGFNTHLKNVVVGVSPEGEEILLGGCSNLPSMNITRVIR